MKEINLENYILLLLKANKLDSKIAEQIPTVKLILKAYQKGLEREDLCVDDFYRYIDLEYEIPAPFHTLVAQTSVVASRKAVNIDDYLMPNIKRFLEDFKYYFLSPTTHTVKLSTPTT